MHGIDALHILIASRSERVLQATGSLPKNSPAEGFRLPCDEFMKSEDAVSPVIGVILMVAVTVILAAVIAAFVFGMAGSVAKTKAVGATARQIGNDITVTWHGGQDNSYVSFYNVSLKDRYIRPGSATGFPPRVGNTTTFPAMGSSTLDHVVVTSIFTDGTTQVILDTYV
jgi:flagellin-like protein